MFAALKNLISDFGKPSEASELKQNDKNLAAAALMFHVMTVDGVVTQDEKERLVDILHHHYGLAEDEAEKLMEEAREAQNNAVDLYAFTSLLKREMIEEERILLIEDLWEMVYADGQLHELEDNVVWRVAELLGVSSRDRITVRQRVLARQEKAS